MAYSFSENFIQSLLARTDIVGLIQARRNLRKSGNNFLGLCPFHEEKTPSFSVNQEKQFYHCFGCGASGDAIQFLIEHDGMHFIDAVEYLAAQCGMELPKKSGIDNFNSSGGGASFVDTLYQALYDAAEIFASNLKKHQISQKAVDYFKSRSITGQAAKLFNLGYALDSWDSLLNQMGKNYELDVLQQASLLVNREGKKPYDVFRDRIIFPIYNHRGKVVGFGGRVIDKGEPKYLNSKESEVFNKSQELYGLFQAKKANRRLNSLIVVEGYMDVVALHQVGISNAVATLGTSINESHIKKIFTLVSEVIFCFDADNAGRKAAWKALELCLPKLEDHVLVRILFLPDGEDPDSFVGKNGKAEFMVKIKQSASVVDLLFEELAKGLDLEVLDEKINYANKVKNYIAVLPKGGIYQQMLYQRLEHLLGMDLRVNQGSAADVSYNQKSYQRNHGKRSHTCNSTKSSNVATNEPAFFILAILLKNRSLLSLFRGNNEFANYDLPGCKLLAEVLQMLFKDPAVSLDSMKAQLPAALTKKLDIQRLYAIARIVPEDGMEPELLGAVKRIKQLALESNLDKLLSKARTGRLTSTDKSLMQKLLLERVK